MVSGAENAMAGPVAPSQLHTGPAVVLPIYPPRSWVWCERCESFADGDSVVAGSVWDCGRWLDVNVHADWDDCRRRFDGAT